MVFKEKCIFIASRITEFPIFRLPPIILKRLVYELIDVNKKIIRLRVKKLKPNYSLHLGCDEDAASRIDPVDVIKFYESKGFTSFNNLSFKQRLFYPNRYIILQKGK